MLLALLGLVVRDEARLQMLGPTLEELITGDRD